MYTLRQDSLAPLYFYIAERWIGKSTGQLCLVAFYSTIIERLETAFCEYHFIVQGMNNNKPFFKCTNF